MRLTEPLFSTTAVVLILLVGATAVPVVAHKTHSQTLDSQHLYHPSDIGAIATSR